MLPSHFISSFPFNYHAPVQTYAHSHSPAYVGSPTHSLPISYHPNLPLQYKNQNLNKTPPYIYSQKKLQHINNICPSHDGQAALYIGDTICVVKVQILASHQIHSVICCNTQANNIFLQNKQNNPILQKLQYKFINCQDHQCYPISTHFEETYNFIEYNRSKGCNVLIQCHAGVSRSGTILCAYLMKKNSWNLQTTYRFVTGKRQRIKPNKGFWRQLQEYQKYLSTQQQQLMINKKLQQIPQVRQESEADLNEKKRKQLSNQKKQGNSSTEKNQVTKITSSYLKKLKQELDKNIKLQMEKKMHEQRKKQDEEGLLKLQRIQRVQHQLQYQIENDLQKSQRPSIQFHPDLLKENTSRALISIQDENPNVQRGQTQKQNYIIVFNKNKPENQFHQPQQRISAQVQNHPDKDPNQKTIFDCQQKQTQISKQAINNMKKGKNSSQNNGQQKQINMKDARKFVPRANSHLKQQNQNSTDKESDSKENKKIKEITNISNKYSFKNKNNQLRRTNSNFTLSNQTKQQFLPNEHDQKYRTDDYFHKNNYTIGAHNKTQNGHFSNQNYVKIHLTACNSPRSPFENNKNLNIARSPHSLHVNNHNLLKNNQPLNKNGLNKPFFLNNKYQKQINPITEKIGLITY